MRVALAFLLLLAATPVAHDAPIQRPVQASTRYCAMDYFGYANLFIPCEYVPLLSPRIGKPPLAHGKYGPWLDVGQDI